MIQRIVGAALLAATSLVLAQETYPAKPVTMIVPFPPGGVADIVGRPLAAAMERTLRQPVVVVNRTGAGGAVGMAAVAKSAPDGYTYLFTSTAFGTLAAMNPKLPYDPMRSFAPVILLGTSPLCLVVNTYFPAKTMKEFVALVRARPNQLVFASTGAGSNTHLALEMLADGAATAFDRMAAAAVIVGDEPPSIAERAKPGTSSSARTSSANTRPTQQRTSTSSGGSRRVCARKKRSTASTSARSAKPFIRTSRMTRAP